MEIITKESLTKGYPDIIAEIEKEAFEKGFSEGMEKGRLSGAESELERIKAVEDQLIPGHEDLIASLKYDGKTTGPEAAVMVLKKEKELAKNRIADMIEDGKKVFVKDALPPDDGEKTKDPAVELEALVKAEMKADRGLSYIDALNRVQKEHPDLAKKIVDEMAANREKK